MTYTKLNKNGLPEYCKSQQITANQPQVTANHCKSRKVTTEQLPVNCKSL